jgi:hypothetical protein
MSVGIYNDPRPDHIACASTSRQKFWTLPRTEQTDRQTESQTDGQIDRRVDGWTDGKAAGKVARVGVPLTNPRRWKSEEAIPQRQVGTPTNLVTEYRKQRLNDGAMQRQSMLIIN